MISTGEFPQWMGCVVIKELQQGMRKGAFIIPFLLVHIAAILAVIIDAQSENSIPYFEISAVLNPLMFLPLPFNPYGCGALWVVIPVVCILIIPLSGINVMSQELVEGNAELLMLTHLKRDRVVLEKFLAGWVLCILMLSSLIPYTLVPYWINGMSIFIILELLLSVILFSGAMSAIILATSGYTKPLHRILFFLLITFTAICCLSATFSKIRLDDGVWWHYLNALISTSAVVLFSLASAKAQLKLTHFFYETKATRVICMLLFFTPLIGGFFSGLFARWIGPTAYLGMAILAWFSDDATSTNTTSRIK